MRLSKTIIVAASIFLGISSMAQAAIFESGDLLEVTAWADAYSNQLNRRNRQVWCDDLRCSKYIERLEGVVQGTDKRCVLDISKSMDKKSGADVVYLLTLVSPETPPGYTVGVLIGNSGKPQDTTTLQEYKVKDESVEIGYRTLYIQTQINNVKFKLAKNAGGEILSLTSDFVDQGQPKTTTCRFNTKF